MCQVLRIKCVISHLIPISTFRGRLSFQRARARFHTYKQQPSHLGGSLASSPAPVAHPTSTTASCLMPLSCVASNPAEKQVLCTESTLRFLGGSVLSTLAVCEFSSAPFKCSFLHMPVKMVLPAPFSGLAFSLRDQKFFRHIQMGARDAPFLRVARKKLVRRWVNISTITSCGHRHFGLLSVLSQKSKLLESNRLSPRGPLVRLGHPFIP